MSEPIARSLSVVRILHTKAFRKLFWSFANRDKVRLTVISPFLGGLPDFSSTVEFARYFLRNEESSFTLVTRPPRPVPDKGMEGVIDQVQAKALVALGVDLRIRKHPTLHSKVYRLDLPGGSRVSFVGSANFTLGGFQNNDETVVFFGRAPENAEVDREVARLLGAGAFPFGEWHILNKRLGEVA